MNLAADPFCDRAYFEFGIASFHANFNANALYLQL